MIPMHPVAGPDAATVRWVVPHEPYAFLAAAAGRGALRELVADGTLAGVEALATCLQTRLGPERSWAAEADRVRAAVRAALEAQAPGCASGPCGSCPRSA